MKSLALGLLLASVGCATPYAYSFHLENRGARPAAKPNDREVLDDADVRAEILVDPTGARAILLDLTNKTEQVLQVEWAQVTMTGPDGSSTSLRPHVDLGWILPGATMSAQLVPFALPPSGELAAGYQGVRFELVVPMIVRRESKLYRYSFAVDVRPIYGGENPSPRRAKPAGSPLPPLGPAVSRLALCARVLPEGRLDIPSTTSG